MTITIAQYNALASLFADLIAEAEYPNAPIDPLCLTLDILRCLQLSDLLIASLVGEQATELLAQNIDPSFAEYTQVPPYFLTNITEYQTTHHQ